MYIIMLYTIIFFFFARFKHTVKIYNHNFTHLLKISTNNHTLPYIHINNHSLLYIHINTHNNYHKGIHRNNQNILP